MHPRVIAIAAVGLVAVAGLAWFLMSPSSPAPATTPAPTVAAPREVAPAPAAPVVEAPRVTAAGPRRPAAPAEPVAAAPVTPAAPTTATLTIESDVEGATVFLDRMSVGTTPLTIPNVTPGSHNLSVSATGFDRHSETIDVEPGARTISVAFREIKLNASVDAVHKHGMGSCKGRLVGSPQGLRYEAADGKDSFSVAFADITAFDLDYLNKNVRLRTRQGRTYNFTESGGNLDKVAYFHADVEKVRKRLAQ